MRRRAGRFYVYMLASHHRSIYVGVTNDIHRRLQEHRRRSRTAYSNRYNTMYLVRIEVFRDPRDAIAREKQLKSWRREKKRKLIEEDNPTWHDLSNDW